MDKKVYVLGDIHGSWKPVRSLCQAKPFTIQKAENTLILLGDVGANFFFNHRDKEFKTKLGKYPFTYFIIRGNHEQRPSICMEQEPDKWHMEEYWGNQVYVENDFPYIKYALDECAIYEIECGNACYKTLVCPGAYSVDKYRRLQMDWSWFPAEQLSAEEMERGLELVEANPAIDIVLSHTCPVVYEPTDLFLSVVDQSLVEKDMERFLSQVENRLESYKLWCWGHYHATRVYPSFEGRQPLMLFNDKAIDLEDWLNGEQKFIDMH